MWFFNDGDECGLLVTVVVVNGWSSSGGCSGGGCSNGGSGGGDFLVANSQTIKRRTKY